MRLFVGALLYIVLPTLCSAGKVALVIGNASYENVAPLDNPINDANDVSAALALQGFDVVTATNLNRFELYDAVRGFRDKADKADIAIVYYAGHGIEIAGENYLIPVDARIVDERDAEIEMIEMGTVLRQLSGAKKLKMLVLDACRDNPFVSRMERENKSRNVGRGLAIVTNPGPATLIAYAAAAGEVTPDGVSGDNSPFTKAFLNALNRPPTDVRLVLGAARDELANTVPGAVPFVYSSLGADEIIINPNSKKPEPKLIVLDEDEILRDYARAEFVTTLDEWDSFLDKYANFPSHVLYILAKRARKQIDEETLAMVPEQPPVTPRPEGRETPNSAKTEAINVQPEADVAGDDQEASTSVSETSIEPVPTLEQEPVILLSVDAATRQVQTVLKDRNCYLSSIDGIWGRGSRIALSRFSSVVGVPYELKDRADQRELNSLVAKLKAAPAGQCQRIVRTTPIPTRPVPSNSTSVANAGIANAPQLRSGEPNVANDQIPGVTCRDNKGINSAYHLSNGLPRCR